MLVKDAKAITGGLGKPSKMPGLAYGLPAAACPTGSRLAEAGIAGPCSDCYAKKANYQYPSVATAQANRLRAIRHPDWTRAMVWSIRRAGETWFRWHDSGDIQDMEHLSKILDVCRQTPEVRHWIPTQEWGMVRKYVESGGTIPANVVVRFSARKYGDQPRLRVWDNWSSVSEGEIPQDAFACPARNQGNQCLDCRACWDPSVVHVVYHKH